MAVMMSSGAAVWQKGGGCFWVKSVLFLACPVLRLFGSGVASGTGMRSDLSFCGGTLSCACGVQNDDYK